MIIGVDFGHTLKGANYGAVGILHESQETRNIGKPLIKYLESMGHTVVNLTVDYAKSNSESINRRVAKANANKLDLIVSIHLNASNGQGHGTEVLTANGKHLAEATRILKNIEKLGYRNRGIKNGTSPRRLGIINSTKAPAMIVECFFCDNKNDVAMYNADKIARAIAEGITNQNIGKTNESNKGDEVQLTKLEVVKLVQETLKSSTEQSDKEHWAEKDFNELNASGVELHDKKFNNYITRGEVIAIANRLRKLK